ncbi:MAG: SPFH domain-containing protein [Eubacteriales bacterium]
MGLFGKEFANVVEWEQNDERTLFWKWKNQEIKKGSKLIIRPGQDAVFLYNGRVEGVFRDEGRYDIESEIIPFLSTLKGFRFGFNSGLRAEVLFVNTKEITDRWGTKNAISIPAAGLPGGLPIRAFGTFSCRVGDYQTLIDRIAGVRDVFTVDDLRERIISGLDQLLMKHIAGEGKDMFNLQASAAEISRGIQQDLDYETIKYGIEITAFAVSSFSYPEEVQKMQEKAAAQGMIGDVNKYQQIAFGDSLSGGGGSAAGSAAGAMAGIGAGMAMAQQFAGNVAGGAGNAQNGAAAGGAGAAGAGQGASPKFCSNCGAPLSPGAKFCSECGAKIS